MMDAFQVLFLENNPVRPEERRLRARMIWVMIMSLMLKVQDRLTEEDYEALRTAPKGDMASAFLKLLERHFTESELAKLYTEVLDPILQDFQKKVVDRGKS